MKTFNTYKSVLFLMILIGWACSNDDNGTFPVGEIQEEIILLEGELVLTNTNFTRTRELLINLSDGALLGDTTFDAPKKQVGHQGDFYVTKENTISRETSSGALVWEREYPKSEIGNFSMVDANSALSTDALFIQYARQDEITFERQYFLEALELTTGDTRWVQELSGDVESYPFIVDNRLLLTPRNSFSPIRYYNAQTGVIEVENNFEDRVDPGRFVIANGTIMASSWRDRILALDENLNIAWTFSTSGTNAIKGILAGEDFVFPSRDENLYSLNQNTGELNWATPLPNRLTLGVHQHQDAIYVFQPRPDVPPQLLAIDLENGTVTATTPIATGATSIDDIRAGFVDGFMVVVSQLNDSQSNIQLIHLATAETVWETTTDNIGFGTTIGIN